MPHSTDDRPEPPARQRVYLDCTHLGRHVTGIERITIDLFESVTFDGADVRPVRARGILSMILRQQLLIPLLALLYPRALFVFPGFPPSPLMLIARRRVVMYVHDLFLLTRRQDLGRKARLYMAWPFGRAVRGLRRFLVNSEKTRAELLAFAPPDAVVALYRPGARNVFALDPVRAAAQPSEAAQPRAPGTLSIIALGTVEPRKNYPAAAAIVDALAARGFPGVRLDIIGREGWGDDTAALARHPRVRLLGYLSAEAARAAIEAADLYLCTSHDEGLGLPLLEVQFAGLAVAAPDAPVFREVLGDAGTFIDPARPDTAADAIAALVSTPGWRARSADAARVNLARWNDAAAGDAARVARLLAGERDPLAGSDAAVAAAGR